MLKIQFKHSKSVNGGARQVKGDSSVKRDFRSPSRPVNKTTPLPSLGRSKRSTQISQSFNQSLMVVDDFSRLVDVFVPDGGTVPHLFLWVYTLKNSKKPHINKAPNRSHLLGSLFGIDVTITISATSDKIQGEWNEDRYQKRHLDVF